MYFKKYFFPKIFLKAISKVDVNFNELHVKFNMQSLKKLFSIDRKVKFDKIDS